jgi:hypothetical protein
MNPSVLSSMTIADTYYAKSIILVISNFTMLSACTSLSWSLYLVHLVLSKMFP